MNPEQTHGKFSELIQVDPTYALGSFQWFHSQDSGVTPNSSPSPTRRVRYRNPSVLFVLWKLLSE